MKLVEALDILKRPVPEGAPSQRVFLACGFSPLHFQTFLVAHLRMLSPQRQVEVTAGLFADLAGNVERLDGSRYDAVVAIIEWQDLDERLGIRRLGGWREGDLADIVNSVESATVRLKAALWRVSDRVPICVCTPTLPLPPLFTPPTPQASPHELQLRQLVASLAASVAEKPSARILNMQRLDEMSPPHTRFDANAELMVGFPYKLPHASSLAELLAALIHNPGPKKGLISDLDDTLWAGILGEVGANGLSWDLSCHSQGHGLFQQFLASLSSIGVLIAAASKNDRALVELAFQRKDLIIPKESVYPIEAHWGNKSESVRRILNQWNIGPESVVFIDDSPMELAEVKAAFPEMECMLFPKHDSQAILDLLKHLRHLFGKSTLFYEDAIRLQSIREAPLHELSDATGSSLDDFLRKSNATIRFALGKYVGDRRAFELVNKTNQFNLNGIRLSESDWQAYLDEPETFLLSVSYEDRYGPLGEIAVLLGTVKDEKLFIDIWVMSCRAFSRRIEYRCLQYLFEKFGADEITFDYHATERNGPLRDFFEKLLHGAITSDLRVTRKLFFESRPVLFHQVKEGSA